MASVVHIMERYEAGSGVKKALSLARADVIRTIRESGIRGRGGAGFPTAVKWNLCAAAQSPKKFIVCNADEGEPGTFKDRLLLTERPEALLDGITIGGYAIGARLGVIYLRAEYAYMKPGLEAALAERRKNKLLGKKVLGKDFEFDIEIRMGAGAYVCGEETALIESLEGERGMPRLKPPFFPAVKGLYMQPTIVNNVETLANLPYIVGEGGAAFKSLGGPTSSGMRMFAVSGHVERPGVFEVPNGTTTFRMLFEAPEYCGGVRAGGRVKAFIPGGASAMWFFEEHLDMPLDKPTVDKAGSMLGSGAIVVMDHTTDMVAACWRIVRFFARESCGKCTPCREGTNWLEKILKRMLDGHGRPEDVALLMEVSESISPGIAWPPRQTTICPLGPSAVSPIASAVRRFRHEFEHYVAHGRPVDGVSSPFARAMAGAR